MPKFFKLLILQLVRLKRKFLLWTKRHLRRITWRNWQKLKWPALIFSALLCGWLLIFLISKLPPRAPRFTKIATGDYTFEAKNKVFQSKLGLKEQNPLISFSVDNTKAITLIYQNPEDNQPSVDTKGKTLTFNDVEPGLQIQYQTLPNGIKEEIILHQKRQKTKDANIFLFEANLENTFVKESLKGFSGPIFYDQYNQYLFHFEKPFAIDAAGNRTDNVSLQIENKNDSKVPAIKNSIDGETPYAVRLTVDEAWLNDPARVYPIIIDPTIVHDTSAEFTVGQLNRIKDLGSGSAPQLESYYQELNADSYTVGLWRMNETSGASVADSSGNGNTGTATNTTIVSGLLGNSRQFSTTSDIITSSTSTAFDLSATSNFTIEGWYYWTTAPGTQILAEKWTSASGWTFYTKSATAGLEFVGTSGSSNTVIANSNNYTWPTNRWVHVAMTKAGSQYTFYADGNNIGSVINTGAIGASANALVLGKRYNGTSNTFNGTMDEVRISNVARTPEEIKLTASRRPYSVYTSDVIDLTNVNAWNDLSWLANGIATGDGETPYSTDGLVAQWNFNETNGTTANSGGSCGDSCDGTLNNFSSSPEPTALATGGTITYIDGYAVHTFTSSGTFTPSQTLNAEVLVVGGGGGGGATYGGGGGGGGIAYNSSYSLNTSPVTVTVGSGGAIETNGENSVFGTITAYGGGHGGSSNSCVVIVNATSGGSGGGGGYSGSGASGTAGQGNSGGSGIGCSSPYTGGGGGGAGGSGTNGNSSSGGNGGNGAAYSISGTSVYYGGGGGGNGYYATGGSGGLGFGQNGGGNTTSLVGGGGGGGSTGASLGAGGNGVVIIRYPISSSVGSGWTTNNKRWGSGALMFDGTNDTITSSAINTITDQLTVESWVKPAATSNISAVVSNWTNPSSNSFVLFSSYTSSKPRFRVGPGGTDYNADSSIALNPGSWYHLVGTYDGSSVKIYVNGQLTGSTATSGNLLTTNNDFDIGSYGGSNFFSGIIDSTRIYSRALTASEILSNYNSSRIELQTRVGSSANTNDGTWEEWQPTINESQIDSLDNSADQWSTENYQNISSNINKVGAINTGTGDDGNCTIDSGTINLNSASCSGRADADAINFSSNTFTDAGSTSITISSSPTGLDVGDEVLIINLQGTSSSYNRVGQYETHTISSISTNTLNFTDYHIQNIYDGTTHKIMVQRVPNYTDVAISGGATLTIDAWNGTKNGVLFFRATGAITNSGYIDVSQKGFRGGVVGGNGPESYIGFANEGGGGGGGGTMGHGCGGTAGAVNSGGIGADGAGNGYVSGTTGIGGNGSATGGGGGGSGYGYDNGTGGSGSSPGGNGGSKVSNTGYAGSSSSGYRGGGGGGAGNRDSAGGGGGGGAYSSIRNLYKNDGSLVFFGSGASQGAGGGGGGGAGDYACANGGGGGSRNGIGGARGTDTGSNNSSAGGNGGAGGGGGGIIIINSNSISSSGYIISNAGNGGNGGNGGAGSGSSAGAGGGGGGGQGGSGGSIVINANSISLTGTTATNYGTGGTGGIGGTQGAGDGGSGYPGIIGYYGSIAMYYSNTLSGSTSPSSFYTQKISPQAKSSGLGSSMQLTTGKPGSDLNTIAIWHLDETGGAGAYIKDSSGNNNHGTPTGTAVTEGTSGKARSFNGSSDYISIGSTANLSPTSQVTVEAWVKTSSTVSSLQSIYDRLETVDGFGLYLDNTGKPVFSINGGSAVATSAIDIDNNAWHYLVGTYNKDAGSSQIKIYVDGVQQGVGTYSTAIDYSPAPRNNIGRLGAGSYFAGTIDEIRISSVARSFEEIAENYRMGRDNRVSKIISSTNLSSTTKLPFWIASDRLGTFSQLTIGESALANYEPDTSTVGLWHLDEQSGAGAYLKDFSGNSNHGTPTGTTFTLGKIGRARYFNGTSSDYLTLPNTIDTPIKNNSFSVSGWIKATNFTNEVVILNRGIVSTGGLYYGMGLYFNSGGLVFNRYIGTSTATAVTYSFTPVAGNWYFASATYNKTTGETLLYLNGQLVASGTLSTSDVAYHASYDLGYAVGALRRNVSDRYSNTIVDEVRVDNVIRSADQIRQAYEVGARTHDITIDFKAKLGAGNLIANSGDLSFIVDETAYGSSAMANHLFLDDKIIVKENYDGTEYLAQGTVNAVNFSTGAVTVAAWDADSTFPTGGFTANATVFKWQREYFDITGSMAEHRDAISRLTYRITDGSQGANIWLDDIRYSVGYLTNPLSSLISSSAGNQYFQYRAILSQNNAPAPSATLTSVSLDYSSNYIPLTPSLDAPLDGAVNQSLLPALKTTATDPDSDDLRYKIELCTDLAMTTNCKTFDQTSSQTGWSAASYSSGAQATYTIQLTDILATNTTYYWRSYAIDPAGSNTWSETQSTPYSFTTTDNPEAPTNPYTENTANPTSVVDTTPEFSAIHNDNDGDSANYYEIEVNTAADFTGTVIWDSGQQSMTTTANGARSPQISYAGTGLNYGNNTYYWRIRFWDTFGLVSPWSDTQYFTTNQKPNIPTLDSPADSAIDQNFIIAFKTTTTDSDSDYLRYKIQLCTNVGMTANCQTFDQTSSQVGWSGQNSQTDTAYTSTTQATYTIQTDLEPNTTYYWRSYAIDPAGTNTWSETQNTPYSFATLATPLPASNCYIQENIDRTQFLLVWTDNASNEDFYEVQRSVDGGVWTTLQTSLAANTVNLLDTSISSGHTYQYRVAPYFIGPYYASWCVASPLNIGVGLFNLEGVNASGLHFN